MSRPYHPCSAFIPGTYSTGSYRALFHGPPPKTRFLCHLSQVTFQSHRHPFVLALTRIVSLIIGTIAMHFRFLPSSPYCLHPTPLQHESSNSSCFPCSNSCVCFPRLVISPLRNFRLHRVHPQSTVYFYRIWTTELLDVPLCSHHRWLLPLSAGFCGRV